jgi:hypothetical protein
MEVHEQPGMQAGIPAPQLKDRKEGAWLLFIVGTLWSVRYFVPKLSFDLVWPLLFILLGIYLLVRNFSKPSSKFNA